MTHTTTAYQPSERIQRLRARAIAQDSALYEGWRRPYFFMEGWMAAQGQPLPIRNAAALAQVIRQMPVSMLEGELLVGEHGTCGDLLNLRAAFPGEWRQTVDPDDYATRMADSVLTPQQQAQFVAWLRAESFTWQQLAPVAPVPEEIRLAKEHGVLAVWGTDLNHSIRGYDRVLRLGFSGIRTEVLTALDHLDHTDPDAPQRRANLLAFAGLCEAAMILGERHAAEAQARAGTAEDPAIRAEWEAIAEVCRRVPRYPARNFREALQALWFAHMITVWEDGVNANGIGRIDQFLWPYLKWDLEEGRLTQEEATELLAALWVKLYQTYDVQQMMIGGQTPEGADATNPLSYLVLDVTEGMDFVRCLSARLHRGSPRAFVARCVDLIAQGGGIPFFFNDEALIPALVGKGITLEDARNYAAIGCIEITIPGKANPHAVSHWINLAKCLELALNDGRCLLTDAQVGPRTGTLAEFRCIDDVFDAFTAQLTYFAKWGVYGSNAAELAHRAQYRLPYLSLLTEDCVPRGLDIIEGGARYNYHSSAAMGIPNVADSLAALQQAVFTEGRATPEEVLTALRTDFAEAEELRLYLRNRVPQYGNDHDLPDGFAAEIARLYCELLAQFHTVSGGTFFTHLFTFTLMLAYGKQTGASPDGRKAGQPLAYSVSPVQGRDREGLTAVLNSLAQIPHSLAAASSSAILEADPSLLQGEGRAAFTDLLITAIDRGVGQLQFNVVDAETLRAAQADPERYRNLCVRVSGFSQQFGLLDAEMQAHIIARTKHRC